MQLHGLVKASHFGYFLPRVYYLIIGTLISSLLSFLTFLTPVMPKCSKIVHVRQAYIHSDKKLLNQLGESMLVVLHRKVLVE